MTKPIPPIYLIQTQIAAACGLSQAQVSRDLTAAGIQSGPNGYSLGDLVRLAEWRALDGVGMASNGRVYDGERERARLLSAQAEIAELKGAQLRRELAPINLIEWALGRVCNQMGAVLDSIPLKVKKMVPRLTAVEIEHIKREVVKAQNAAARVNLDLDEYYGDAPIDATAAPLSP